MLELVLFSILILITKLIKYIIIDKTMNESVSAIDFDDDTVISRVAAWKNK